MANEYAKQDAEPLARAVRHPHIPGMWCYRLSDPACKDARVGALDFAEGGAAVCAVADIVDVKPKEVLAYLCGEGFVESESGVAVAGVIAAIERFGGAVAADGLRTSVDTHALEALQKHLADGMPAVVYMSADFGRDVVVAAAGYDARRHEVLLFDPRGAERDGWYSWAWVESRVAAFVLAAPPEDDRYMPRSIFKQIYGIDIAGREQRWPDIDLAALREVNPGCIGWIHLGGTPLSYPIVKDRLDATYYQTHNFSGEPSVHGAVSLSFANGGAFNAPNLVFSAHRMKDYSMFKMLTVYDRPDFSKEHPYIDLLLGETLYKASVFSAYHFPKGSGEREPYRVSFDDEQDLERWAAKRVELSMHPFPPLPDNVEQVATFRTCYGLENDKTFVVHALLKR